MGWDGIHVFLSTSEQLQNEVYQVVRAPYNSENSLKSKQMTKNLICLSGLWTQHHLACVRKRTRSSGSLNCVILHWLPFGNSAALWKTLTVWQWDTYWNICLKMFKKFRKQVKCHVLVICSIMASDCRDLSPCFSSVVLQREGGSWHKAALCLKY